MQKRHYILIVGFLSLLLYIVLSYFTNRSNFNQLLIVYVILFASYVFFLRNNKFIDSKYFFYLGLIFRVSILFSVPNLSDDFYRFIWDGILVKEGFNPLKYFPAEILESLKANHTALSSILFEGMNSQTTYTCYPPVNQLFFLFGALFSKYGILIVIISMKILILAAEIGTYFIIQKLLKFFNFPSKNILIYWLNPLVIIELVGNLHYEGLMIFFLLIAFYYLRKEKYYLSAIIFTISVSVKLIPLMFLPVLFWHLGLKNWIKYCMIVCLGTALLFIPFLGGDSLANFFSSLDLYFRKFEFNASIYYIVRQIGYWIKGYNIIRTAGIVLAFISFGFILIIGFQKRNKIFENIFISMLMIISIYYFFAMIVHPWYLITLIAISVFTNLKYPIIWSLLIILSYYTYKTSYYNENLLFVSIEYIVVYLYILIELNIKILPIKFLRYNKIWKQL